MKIFLRKIKKSDWPYFLKWWQDKKLVRLTSGIFEHSAEKLKKYFLAIVTSKKDYHYIIETKRKKIIGHLALNHKNKNRAETQIVIGEKKYWDKGIGAQTIKQLIAIAFSKLGYKEIYLEVRSNNLRALNLYKDCGFKKIGIKRYPKNKYLPKVLMMLLTKKY